MPHKNKEQRAAYLREWKAARTPAQKASDRADRRAAYKRLPKAEKTRKNTRATELSLTQPARRLTGLWYSAGVRARKKNLAFDETAKPTEIPATCPLTGLALSLARGPGRRRYGVRRPSLDQIRPGAGYITGNVRVVSTWANIAKMSLSDPEFLGFCAAVCIKAALDGRTVEDAPLRLRHALRKLSDGLYPHPL